MDERIELVERLSVEIDRVLNEYKGIAEKNYSTLDEAVINDLEELRSWAAGTWDEKKDFLRQLKSKAWELTDNNYYDENVLWALNEISKWVQNLKPTQKVTDT
ncbi:MAG: hypothetical protein LBI14_01425 [Treponema sp.]|jgi:hypothetical protein|nr:hypothetical protein [Treponema sp.]